jgi:hypothetical protein
MLFVKNIIASYMALEKKGCHINCRLDFEQA